MKKWILPFLVLSLIPNFFLKAGEPNEMLEQDSVGVRRIVKEVNSSVRAGDPYSDPEAFFILEGCYGGKKGEEFSNNAVKVTSLYYSEIFKKNTTQVTRIHFKFNKPVPLGVAQNYAGDFAPFVRGRNFTQQHKIDASEGGECVPKNGGIESRYTKDYFIEFYYAPGTKLVQEARLWNANYNN